MHQPPLLRLAFWGRLVALSLLLGFGLLTGSLLMSRTAHAQPLSSTTITNCTNDSQLQSAVRSASSGDTITFGCSGDIPLTSFLGIAHNLTLDGSGQHVTLDGQDRVRVFIVNPGGTFALNALTIAHGFGDTDGGGIYNNGTVTISNSTFANNSANIAGGGLFNYDTGTVTISNSTFTNNSALVNGGGIYNYHGSMSISNSTFASNTSFSNQSGVGGALVNDTGTLTISNSTFANNSANVTGGIINVDSGSMTISNSIVANNSAGNCAQFTPITDQGYNLSSDSTCGFTASTSQQNTDPGLDPNGLQSNGGSTQTIALQKGSPAIDQIPVTSCPTSDQRGTARPDDGETTCDMGAYESNYPSDNDLGLTNLPANITTDATGPQGAVVTYTSPTVVDEDSPLPTASCSPSSGSTFAIGTTTVTCTVSDSDDVNSPVSHSFQVVVQDTLPPSLQLPSSPVTANATSPQGAAVTYTVTATDPVYPSHQLTINCTPASGSTFPIGTTTVNCTASDPAGNSTSGSFQVVVVGASGQVSSTISLVNSFGLPADFQASFDTQLQAVQADLTNNNPTQACSDLTAFINHVQAQSGKGLTVSQADQLITAAKQVQAVLGC